MKEEQAEVAQVVAQIQNAYAYHVRNPIYQIPTKKQYTPRHQSLGKDWKGD